MLRNIYTTTGWQSQLLQQFFQTVLAICDVKKEISQNKGSPCLNSVDFSKFLVFFLGIGSSKRDEKLEVGDGNSWGLFSWFMGPDNTTLLFDVVLNNQCFNYGYG